MARPASGRSFWRRIETPVLCCGLIACVVVAGFEADPSPRSSVALGVVLGVAAFAAGITVIEVGSRVQVSSTFIVVLLSAAFLGPLYAGLTAVIAEIAAGRRIKTRRYAVAFNLLAAVLPAIVAANIVRAFL